MISKQQTLIQISVSNSHIMNQQNYYYQMLNSKTSKFEHSPIYYSQQSQQISLFSETHSKKLQEIQSIFNESTQQYANDPIKKLKHVQRCIEKKMIQLDALNGFYYEKQQKMFLKTFINIMDRMSNELLQAKLRYDNIDQEIDNEPECVRLRDRLNFYKDECIILGTQLKNIEREYDELRKNNEDMKEGNRVLENNLKSQAKKQMKYRTRKYSLETKMQSVGLQFVEDLSIKNKNHNKLLLPEKTESMMKNSAGKGQLQDDEVPINKKMYFRRQFILRNKGNKNSHAHFEEIPQSRQANEQKKRTYQRKRQVINNN